MIEVAAGEEWDPLVERWVAEGFAGVECLPGIPGSVGATPIQNVGAYGQEVSETIVAVRAYDRRAGEVVELSPAECGFTYRSSAFKRDPSRWVVLAVRFALDRSGMSRAVRYAELARRLDAPIGAAAPSADVRAAVLALRRSKGMVIDPADPDSVSAGSFFTNPIVGIDEFGDLVERVGTDVRLPHWPEPDGRVKTSAAWLIERAGFGRGFALAEAPGRGDLGQAHAGADQPRRRDDERAGDAGAPYRRRRRGEVRRRSAPRAGVRRARVGSAGVSACVFCAIASGEASAARVFEDDEHVAFLDRRPVFKGHVLLIPRPHIETLPDLAARSGGAAVHVGAAVERGGARGMDADGTFIAINNVISQSVPHLHVHIVPRRRRDGLRGFFWPRTKYADDAEMEAVAARIRETLADR